MLSNAVNTIASATYLSRKAIFDHMNPANLLVLSTHSTTSLEMIKTCALKASLTIRFSERDTIVHVTTSTGLYSEIVVGHYMDKEGKELNVTIDGELVERCYLTRSGLIIPHRLDVILRRIFSIYSSIHTHVEELELVMAGDRRIPELTMLLSELKDYSKVQHISLWNAPHSGLGRLDVAGLEEVCESLQVEQTLTFDKLPLNVPLSYLAVPHLTIKDRIGLSEEYIVTVLMDLPGSIFIAEDPAPAPIVWH